MLQQVQQQSLLQVKQVQVREIEWGMGKILWVKMSKKGLAQH
jgi:hypothetical protein